MAGQIDTACSEIEINLHQIITWPPLAWTSIYCLTSSLVIAF